MCPMWLRLTLCSEGFWGPADENVPTAFGRAYSDFKSWCHRNHISCSQPKFTEGFDASLQLILFTKVQGTIFVGNVVILLYKVVD